MEAIFPVDTTTGILKPADYLDDLGNDNYIKRPDVKVTFSGYCKDLSGTTHENFKDILRYAKTSKQILIKAGIINANDDTLDEYLIAIADSACKASLVSGRQTATGIKDKKRFASTYGISDKQEQHYKNLQEGKDFSMLENAIYDLKGKIKDDESKIESLDKQISKKNDRDSEIDAEIADLRTQESEYVNALEVIRGNDLNTLKSRFSEKYGSGGKTD
ncbi:hypothetical protein C1645_837469 [Glomus cerebriforme]|uniref:Uncharacterized protein n=1 Tax=Glomus cerebriforme TaxID=658196 RepID=A0A397S713_9GLOM|nr:hypothetical protein C1645_839253 [Glomus cerebriforme]RIA81145.1 hypothetical protein C1645_837469 [Glomus cerebriforme]